ncbi:MAG: virulence RhuM family protein [Alphaproteobacteria bacterium]|nr:virulence RhuM family protein [Alphaproteobacteria bacterium]
MLWTTGVSRWKANSKPTFSRIGKRSLEGTEIPPALAGWFFILSVGYRIKSKTAVHFRKRATSVLKQYLVALFGRQKL